VIDNGTDLLVTALAAWGVEVPTLTVADPVVGAAASSTATNTDNVTVSPGRTAVPEAPLLTSHWTSPDTTTHPVDDHPPPFQINTGSPSKNGESINGRSWSTTRVESYAVAEPVFATVIVNHTNDPAAAEVNPAPTGVVGGFP